MQSSFLSQRFLELEPSATMAMNAKAKKLREEGKDVISFSVGEPDFRTPKHICEAAKKAIDDGFHAYTPVAGVPELRRAIAAMLTRDTGVEYRADQVVASPGGKFSLYLSLLALVNPGDEVVIPAPYWVSYPEMVRLVGGVPVIVDTREEDSFALNPNALEQAVTPRTKLLILNSPSNPTGQVIPPEQIAEIGRIMEKKGIWCISDEIYNRLIFGSAAHKSVASVSEYCRDHTVVVNGCSKTYAMTGWRMGWIGARAEVAKAVDDMQSQTASNVCTIAQAAAIAALTGPQDSVEEMRVKFEERRDLIHRLLNEIPGVTCPKPRGAFYAFPNVAGLLGREIAGKLVKNPKDLCNLALQTVHIAMVAGEPFGSNHHVRLSYATSERNIEEGCRRFKELVGDKI